jgi:hypothetical protein
MYDPGCRRRRQLRPAEQWSYQSPVASLVPSLVLNAVVTREGLL